MTVRRLCIAFLLVGLAAVMLRAVIPNRISCGFRTRPQKVISDLYALDAALREYAIRHEGRWPQTLAPLVEHDENGYTLLDRRSVPLDPWKRPYGYDPPSAEEPRTRVYTLGADGEPGGTRDDADLERWLPEKR